MTDWKQANRLLREGYDTRVPDYDLKPVLELISGIDPKQIAAAMTEAIISIADDLLLGNRVSNARTQDTVTVLKAIFRTFENISFDVNSFMEELDQQISNSEGIYAEEPDIIYPMGAD